MNINFLADCQVLNPFLLAFFPIFFLYAENIDEVSYFTGDLNQLIFIDKKTVDVIDAIINNSVPESIVILQNDHGLSLEIDWNNKEGLRGTEVLFDPKNELSLKKRSSILNAYYFPQKIDYENLYQSISPVNSFRVLFNQFFGGRFELLEDRTIIDK